MNTKQREKWALRGERFEAVIIGGEKSASGEVFIQRWTKNQRNARALKTLAICWVLAIASAGIPFLHFITVPLLFLAGLIVPLFLRKKESMLLGGFGTCPYCAQPFTIVGGADIWPVRDHCHECKRHVRVEKAA